MDSETENFKLNSLLCRRFSTMLGLMYPRWSSMTVPLTLFVVLISILNEVLTYYVGVLPSEYFVVLTGRDRIGFNALVVKSAFILIGKAFVLTTATYTTNMLYLHWRRLVCQRLHEVYLKGFVIYDLAYSPHAIDNPDQRITQDVEKTCRLFSDIFCRLIISPFIIIYYSYMTYASTGYLGPVTIYLYFIIATIVNKMAMSPVVRNVVKQEQKEGDFRFKHVALRTHSEAIAFYHSSSLERLLTNEELEHLLRIQQQLINWRFQLNFVTNLSDYFGGFLSYLILSVPVFLLGTYDHVPPAELSGLISRNAFYYLYLINSFSTLITLAQTFSDIAGTTHRVIQLYEVLLQHQNYGDGLTGDRIISWDDSNNQNGDNETSPLLEGKQDGGGGTDAKQPKVQEDFPAAYSLRSVTYCIPYTQQRLIKNLTLNICFGINVLITGDSGCGKTSLLRVLCGFWNIESGKLIQKYPSKLPKILFVPQKPYFPPGTLRQQIVYPCRAVYCTKSIQPRKLVSAIALNGEDLDIRTDNKLLDYMQMLKLEYLLERTNGFDEPVTFDWNHVLTPGEMQRLSIMRVLFHKPNLIFLDEATSAVGFDHEQTIYEVIAKEGITCVSIGHRDSLRKFHDLELNLDSSGSWHLVPISSKYRV